MIDKTERVAVCGPGLSKSAALLFDKVIVLGNQYNPVPEIPPSVGRPELLKDVTLEYRKISEQKTEIITALETLPWEVKSRNKLQYDHLRMLIFQDIVLRSKGINSIPLFFHDQQMFMDAVSGGKTTAYIACVDNIPVADVDYSEWEQLIEFRSDQQAANNYRDFRLWVETSLTSDTREIAREKVEQKLEDYRQALKKHGLKTKVGALKQILSSKVLTAISASSIAGAITNTELYAAVASGMMLIGNAALWLAEEKMKLDEIHQQHREIAIIKEINDDFGPQK